MYRPIQTFTSCIWRIISMQQERGESRDLHGHLTQQYSNEVLKT